jgi:hypothetical protein
MGWGVRDEIRRASSTSQRAGVPASASGAGRESSRGARSFAEDPEHYDFYGPRCVKDLTVDGMTYRDTEEEVSLSIHFRPNQFKHSHPLVVCYSGVLSFTIEVGARQPVGTRLGSAILDEILPHDHGCSHEIAFHSGTIKVICADLTAIWSDREDAETGVDSESSHEGASRLRPGEAFGGRQA